jgi:hypothetical protein
VFDTRPRLKRCCYLQYCCERVELHYGTIIRANRSPGTRRSGGGGVGSAAISTACWVWLKKQIFAYGGSALCGAGVVLLGLSIWHSVDFGVTSNGLTLKLQAELDKKLAPIQAQVASIKEDSASTEKHLAELNEKAVALEKAASDAKAYADFTAAAASSTSALATAAAETGRQIGALTAIKAKWVSVPGGDADVDVAVKGFDKALEKAAHDTGIAVDKSLEWKSKCGALGIKC